MNNWRYQNILSSGKTNRKKFYNHGKLGAQRRGPFDDTQSFVGEASSTYLVLGPLRKGMAACLLLTSLTRVAKLLLSAEAAAVV